jgi:SAM-dependent methyltransferase
LSEAFGPVAAFYDDLMEQVPYRMWTSYLLLLWASQEVKPKKILDVCCGTGTMAQMLVDEGRKVTGFDLSPAMIEKARLKSEGDPRLRFEVADAAEFELGETFEAAYSFFDSLNYITDPARLAMAFKQVANHLEPGASWIFDLNTEYAFDEELFDQENLKAKAKVRYKWHSEWDRETRIIRVNMTFWRGEEETHEVHVQRAHPDSEVREMLAAAGFGDVRCYHSYTLERPRKTSDRVHYVARKLG